MPKNNLISCIPLIGMVAVTGLVAVGLRVLPSSADTNVSTSLIVQPSCSFTGTTDEIHEAKLINGQYKEDIGVTTLRTYCNDANGYEIYAQGFSNDTLGDTNLIEQLEEASTDTPNTIITALYPGKDNLTNSTPSSWSMKLAPVSGTYTPDIISAYNNIYGLVPSASTKVASYPAGASGKYKTDSSLITTYDAYINQTQPAGTYQGKVKYTMLQQGVIIDQTLYIQDLTLDDCKVNVGTNGNAANIGDNITVIDKRDGNDYTVRYINGYCWMTQNLRIAASNGLADGYISAEDSDFTGNDIYIGNDQATGNCKSSGSIACSKFSTYDDTGDVTGYYNFCAASATKICNTNSKSTSTSSSICPAGWRLPTGPATNSDRDWYKLYQSSSNSKVINEYLTAFMPVYSGSWVNGSQKTAIGRWWTATTSQNGYPGNVDYSDGTFSNDESSGFDQGFTIRCVRTS